MKEGVKKHDIRIKHKFYKLELLKELVVFNIVVSMRLFQ